MAKDKDKYAVLMTISNVAVTVPAEGDDYFNFEPSNTLGNGFVVPDRWLATKLVAGHVIKISFYGLTPEQLGQKICFGTIEIRERENADGKGSVTLIACKEPKPLDEATNKLVIDKALPQHLLPGGMAVKFPDLPKEPKKDKPVQATQAQPTTAA